MSRSISVTDAGRRLWRDRRGGALVEFGLIVPVLVMLTLGIFEFTIAMLEYHRLGEATRRGARQAIISAPVANLTNLAALTEITCTKNSGTLDCEPAAIETGATFDAILAAMQAILPSIGEENLVVTYGASDIGSLDIPAGIKPFVTITLRDMRLRLTTLSAIPGVPVEIELPPFTTTVVGSSYTAG